MHSGKRTRRTLPLQIVLKWTLPLILLSGGLVLVTKNTSQPTHTFEATIYRTLAFGSIGTSSLALISIFILIFKIVTQRKSKRTTFKPVPFAWKIFGRKSTLQKETEGWIYIMTNPAMPGICKVGYTDIDPHTRAKQLNNTSTASDFVVAWSCQTRWAHQIEQQTHRLLTSQGLHTKREFFHATLTQVIANIEKAKQHILQISTEHTS